MTGKSKKQQNEPTSGKLSLSQDQVKAAFQKANARGQKVHEELLGQVKPKARVRYR